MTQFSFVMLLFYSSFLFSLTRTCISSLESINTSKGLRDGETLVSVGQTFELGFFSLSNPKLRYLGIWYNQITPRTIVWVANRETPLSNTLGALTITSKGNLLLVNDTNHIFWSSNTSTAKDPVALLLDSGNFVVRDANDRNNREKFLWQSIDYPVNTLLEGMKLGINLATGQETFLSSWKSIEDPAPGLFYTHLDLQGYPQFLLKRENKTYYRIGSWNGQSFTGVPMRSHIPFTTFEFVSNDKEIYLKYEVHDSSIFVRSTLTPSGAGQSFSWSAEANDWVVLFTTLTDQCGNYALCGAYASCEIINTPVCSCLDGFIPKSPKDWDMLVWTDGCVRRTPLNCSNNDGFLKHSGITLPDTSSSWYDKNIGLKECENLCLINCTCTAYANLDIREGGSGCLLWFNDLIDISGLDAGGQDLYVKLAASELHKIQKKRSSRKKKAIIITSAIVVVISMPIVFYKCRRNLRKHGMTRQSHIEDYETSKGKEDMDLLMFDLTTIVNATCNFSNNNKLGQGGFGPVYKGTLADGQEMAVKRLSKSSGQGLTEFKNEVILISKLQHRNLVKLLGCCIQKDEKMLIYEFMPNKSLDSSIFDETKNKLLDWHKRFHIIDGIARGLLYLHQDSRLRIIHRDLKTSNVLLDKDMNPKISDFGMARIFGGDQTEANTNKVAGTYGYMSPEYAVDGLFSMKSDVFSFGVLTLELISGKRNRGFSHPDHDHNLVGHAWKLWIEERSLELVDNMLDSFTISEVLRCIHVGLLCVQQRPEDRPNMSLVVTMLGSESSLPKPKQPGFYIERNVPKAECSSSEHGSSSINEMSTTLIEGR